MKIIVKGKPNEIVAYERALRGGTENISLDQGVLGIGKKIENANLDYVYSSVADKSAAAFKPIIRSDGCNNVYADKA